MRSGASEPDFVPLWEKMKATGTRASGEGPNMVTVIEIKDLNVGTTSRVSSCPRVLAVIRYNLIEASATCLSFVVNGANIFRRNLLQFRRAVSAVDAQPVTAEDPHGYENSCG